MSKRLQVVMDEEEAEEYRRQARREGKTLSQWVRQVLRQVLASRRGPSAVDKLRALDLALRCGHPTSEIDQLLAEIESGRDLR